MDRLQVSARRLRIAVLVLLAILIAAYATVRLGIDLGPQVQIQRAGGAPTGLAATLAGDVAVVLFAIALWRLSAMLGLLASGERFTAPVAAAFRSFALWLLLAALAQILVPLVVALAGGGSGGRVAMVFDLRELFAVIAALVLFLVARMLEEAARIDLELREIV